MDEFQQSAENVISLSAKTALLSFCEYNCQTEEEMRNSSKTLDDFNFKLKDIILWSISDELSDDPIKGWLKANGSCITCH